MRPVAGRAPERSIGSERTFDVDCDELVELERTLRSECEGVARRLRQAALTATTVTVKVRFADFRTIDRSHSLPSPSDSQTAIFRVARELLRHAIPEDASVRLVGVRCGGLADVQQTGHQLSFDQGAEARAVAEEAVDQVVAKFGPGAVRRASLIKGREEFS